MPYIIESTKGPKWYYDLGGGYTWNVNREVATEFPSIEDLPDLDGLVLDNVGGADPTAPDWYYLDEDQDEIVAWVLPVKEVS